MANRPELHVQNDVLLPFKPLPSQSIVTKMIRHVASRFRRTPSTRRALSYDPTVKSFATAIISFVFRPCSPKPVSSDALCYVKMKGLLACLLLCCLFGLCVGNGVPVCLKSFTLTATSGTYRAVYMACDNGQFVDLGSSEEHLKVQEFDPPKEVEESLFYYETLDCNVRGESSYRSEDRLLGSFQLRGYDFDREEVVGRRTSAKFLMQFVRCPEEKPPQTVSPQLTEEISQKPAVGSKVAPVRLET